MKKTLLALAITALSANAFAVNLDTPAGTTKNFASEINTTAPVVLGTAGVSANNPSTTATAGFALTNSYVRYELGNGATFSAAVLPADLTGATATVASGGTIGSNFVIFNIAGAVLATDSLIFATPVKVTSQSAVTISYSIHQQASDAVNKVNSLASKSGTLLQFTKALQTVSTPTTPALINAISAASKKFVSGGVGTDVAQPVLSIATTVAVSVPVVSQISGAAVTLVSQLVASSTMTVSGNFSAAANAAGEALTTGNGYILSADKQSATKSAAADAETATYTVGGTALIAETKISATYTPTAVANYTTPAVTISNINELKNNGSTASAAFVLKPNGSYKNFVRVSNTGSVATLFTMTLTNDAGASTTINMADVTGQSATAIPAGGSSAQMSIVDIHSAAVANGFVLSGEGKLRLAVTGATTGVSLQNYVTSIDGNVLSATSINSNL
jgi:hypothetical protein